MFITTDEGRGTHSRRQRIGFGTSRRSCLPEFLICPQPLSPVSIPSAVRQLEEQRGHTELDSGQDCFLELFGESGV